MIYRSGIHKIIGRAVLFTALIASFAAMNVNAMQDNTPITVEANAVVSQYFVALSNGEVKTIRQLLGPKLLQRRVRLLSNPTYSSRLREIYRDSEFTITEHQVMDNATVSVNVEVTLSGAEKNRYRFVLKKVGQSGMRIFEENEIL